MSSIKIKLTLTIVVLILLSVTMLGSINYWNAKKIIVQDLEGSLTDLSRGKAQELSMWFAERKSDMSFLANSPLIYEGKTDEALNYLKNENKRNPLAAYIFSRYSLIGSSSIIQRPLRFSTHFMQAIQPRTVFPPIRRISVSHPAVSRGSSTFLSRISVLPPGLGLPFIATAFMSSPFTCYGLLYG
jgi:hypothetical protein